MCLSKETNSELTATPYKDFSEDVTAIIRSIGERTEYFCHYLLSQQIPEENIILIKEAPFSAALAKSFEIGLERNLPWTFCLDADVLIKQNAVEELLSVAEQLDEKDFGIQGLVLCKFFGGLRGAGNRLYRTSLLSQALDCIPQKETIRPETDTIRAMEAKGFPWKLVDVTVGLHDYEQFYKDIYRKCFTQAHKHHYLMKKLFHPLWTRLALEDPDYQVALWGLRSGSIFDAEVQINIEQFPEQIDELLATQGWEEKQKQLPLEEFYKLDVKKMIDDFSPSEEYIYEFEPTVQELLGKVPQKLQSMIFHRMYRSQKIPLLVKKKIRQINQLLESYSN